MYPPIHCGLVVVLIAASTLRASPYYLVSSRLPGGVGEAGLYRLQDVNGDGDALNARESVLWGRGLAAPGDVRMFDRAVLTADAARGQLIRFADVNGDGDALDVAESIVWAEGMGTLFGFDTMPDGTVIAADLAADVIYQLRDQNGDGDALDQGERLTFANSIDAPVSVRIGREEIVVASDSGDGLYQLIDVNGDGDALDSGENILFSAPGVFQATGLTEFSVDSLLVSARATDTVYRVEDLNGDGDALDMVELLSYANSTFGMIDGPWNMTTHSSDGVLLVEHDDGEVSLLRDVNGDGDALDIGEVTRWSAGLNAPVGIVRIPEPSSLLLMMGLVRRVMLARKLRRETVDIT